MSQKSPKFLITLAVILSLAITSAAGFLMLKDKKIDFGKIASIFNIFSKAEKQESQTTQADTKKRQLLDKSAVESPEAQDEKNLSTKLSQSVASVALLTNFDPKALEENPEVIDQILEQAGIDPETSFPLPIIPDNEIRVSYDNNKETIEAYIIRMNNLLDEKIKADSLTQKQPDIEVMQEAMKTKNFSALIPYLESTTKIIEQLKEVEVPSSWAEIHKEQISLFMLEKNIYQAVIETEEDPVKAMMAITRYRDLPNLMNDLFDKMLFLREAQKNG